MESKINANVPVDDKPDAKGPLTPLKGDAPDAPGWAAPDPDLTFTCDRCNDTIPSSSVEEHQDWHFAQDLQAQEQDGPVEPPPAADARQPTGSLEKAGGDNLKTPDPSQPPEYAPPPHPPPPRNRTSRSTSTSTSVLRHHTNQVIEAAKIRARDEVPPSLSDIEYLTSSLTPTSNKCRITSRAFSCSTESTTQRLSLNMTRSITAIAPSTSIKG